ncbi:hypothetical protein [Fischerella sp. PCC 9605]|uniref:hypothetical protein n=1 Tax=Fischerella sp. PCC 9605 TaxID=1173024 RepID=UPI0004BA47BD|nr:hypothetical protein [Fischerella sp. PCC 9605]
MVYLGCVSSRKSDRAPHKAWCMRLHSLAVDVRSEDAKVSDDGVRRAIALLTRRGVYAFTLWRWMCAQRMQRFLMNE